MNELGETIKARRKMLHITQRTLAELADVSINTLNKIEIGEANPSYVVLKKILDTLGLEIKVVVKKNE